jgi:putative tryptophan/tyrosine transport system substrate-binding protein
MTPRMRRREFFGLVGGAAAWPLAARAQQPTLPVIVFLNGNSPGAATDALGVFRQGLSDSGYVEHRTVGIDYCPGAALRLSA